MKYGQRHAVAALLAATVAVIATAAVAAESVPAAAAPGLPSQPPGASPPERRALGGSTDFSRVTPRRAVTQELPTWRVPDGRRVVFTSTRDLPELALGNWSDERNYPQGAELYIADLDGAHLERLTNNAYYDAGISVSPDGRKIVFSRQVDGALDLWLMNIDGSGERRLTDTPDWQEGAPFFLPDSKTITTRAWSRAEYGKRRPTPMTIWTFDTETGERIQRTHDDWMNWAPYPAPDGRHYVFVRPLLENPGNWEIFLGDLEGGEPVRLTFNDSFDGFPAISPDGRKLIFSRSEGPGFMSGLYTYVMDISSLGLGPKAVKAGATR